MSRSNLAPFSNLALFLVLLGMSAEPILAGSIGRQRLTSLLMSAQNPCVAENFQLQSSGRYICDSSANVICLPGWKEPDDPAQRVLANPCPLPICEFQNGTSCERGKCVRPGTCGCEVGWYGHRCHKCVTLPGCVNGWCGDAFDCICNLGTDGSPDWTGPKCDVPACNNCDKDNGVCYEPNVCNCLTGWEGDDCKTCIKLPGCVNGDCEPGRPHTCQCSDGWQGPLCDQPTCTKGCNAINGYCNEPNTCLCKMGWEGPTCEQCSTYWACPAKGTCVEPNQCICDNDTAKNDELGDMCNSVDINGPKFGSPGACSNPCKQNPSVPVPPGKRVQKCRWSETGTTCQDVSVDCYGDKDWIILGSGVLDHNNCIHALKETPTQQNPVKPKKPKRRPNAVETTTTTTTATTTVTTTTTAPGAAATTTTTVATTTTTVATTTTTVATTTTTVATTAIPLAIVAKPAKPKPAKGKPVKKKKKKKHTHKFGQVDFDNGFKDDNDNIDSNNNNNDDDLLFDEDSTSFDKMAKKARKSKDGDAKMADDLANNPTSTFELGMAGPTAGDDGAAKINVEKKRTGTPTLTTGTPTGSMDESAVADIPPANTNTKADKELERSLPKFAEKTTTNNDSTSLSSAGAAAPTAASGTLPASAPLDKVERSLDGPPQPAKEAINKAEEKGKIEDVSSSGASSTVEATGTNKGVAVPAASHTTFDKVERAMDAPPPELTKTTSGFSSTSINSNGEVTGTTVAGSIPANTLIERSLDAPEVKKTNDSALNTISTAAGVTGTTVANIPPVNTGLDKVGERALEAPTNETSDPSTANVNRGEAGVTGPIEKENAGVRDMPDSAKESLANANGTGETKKKKKKVNKDAAQKAIDKVKKALSKKLLVVGNENLNEEVINKVGNQVVNQDVNQSVNKEVIQEVVNKEVNQEVVNKEGNQVVNQDVSQGVNKEVNKEIVNKEVNKEVNQEVANKEVNQVVNQDVKQDANKEVNKEIVNKDVNNEVNKEVIKDINKEVNKEVVNKEVNKEAKVEEKSVSADKEVKVGDKTLTVEEAEKIIGKSMDAGKEVKTDERSPNANKEAKAEGKALNADRGEIIGARLLEVAKDKTEKESLIADKQEKIKAEDVKADNRKDNRFHEGKDEDLFEGL